MTTRKAVVTVMNQLPAGKEFTARQFKYWFDSVYGENSFYIDTVMRRVRQFCRLNYCYSKKTKLYTKVEINGI